MGWQLKRNDNAAVMDLPDDLLWEDEFAWSQIAQSAPVYMLSGAIDIQQGIKLAGRPITLTGDWAWITRGELETLHGWSEVAELTMTLMHYDGRTFNVAWRLHETATNAAPVQYMTPESADDKYIVTLRLMTV